LNPKKTENRRKIFLKNCYYNNWYIQSVNMNYIIYIIYDGIKLKLKICLLSGQKYEKRIKEQK